MTDTAVTEAPPVEAQEHLVVQRGATLSASCATRT